jgi:nucleotide-binding universal stress UspA family protein
MFTHILVPLDGSPLAECALSHVVSLAGIFEAKVTLIQVLEVGASSCQAQAIDPLDWSMCRVGAEAYLDEAVERLKGKGCACERIILEGSPAQRIVEFVRNKNVDLVVLSSHGRGGLSGWNVSGVGQKILQRSKVSVFLVRSFEAVECPQEPVLYKRIAVPLDGSQRAECALAPATTISRAQDIPLILMHVVRRPEMPRFTRSPEDLELADRIVQRNLQETGRHLEQLQERLSPEVQVRIAPADDVASALHAMIGEEKIDLVVMAAHGYSGKTKWTYGSIATSFIGYCPAPLLVVQDLSPEQFDPTFAELASRETKGH